MADGQADANPGWVAFADQAPCALLRTSATGLLLQVNQTFCAWTGHTADELVGQRRLQDLLTIGGKIFHQTHWLPLLQMQGSIAEVRLELVRKDGTVFPMIVNAVLRQDGGQAVHDIAAFISRDRDRFEQELLLSRKKLEVLIAESKQHEEIARDRALFAEQMVGIVSHDLKNPLSTVSMGATVLGRGELSNNQLRVVGRIASAAARANRMITDLLDFTQARIGSGLSVSPKSMDLHATIADAVEELALAFPARVVRHVRQGEGAAWADGDRLSQLVANLVANALAYGQPDSPVTVTSAITASGFALSVHNAGEPIPPALQPALFTPMVRGDAAENAGRSVGLGLYIVSEIAKAHGGRVELVSTRDGGTVFTMTVAAPSSPAGVAT